MRRSSKGRFRNNWYKNNRKNNKTADTHSLNNSASSSLLASSTSRSSRAPANQLPIVIPIYNDKNVWKLYFLSEEQSSDSDLAKNIKIFNVYIENNSCLFDLQMIGQTDNVLLDVHHLISDADFINAWPTFQNDLFQNPNITLRTMEYCLHEYLKSSSRIRVRILNHEPIVPIANFKNNYYGKLVTVIGTVTRLGSIGLICTSMAFECCSCQNIQAVMQPQGIFTAPTFCQSCKSGHEFEPLQSSPLTNTTDWQMIKIQEIQSKIVSETLPSKVDIELRGDLVGSGRPGEDLLITGIVQIQGESKGGEDDKKLEKLSQYYIEAVSVHKQKNLCNSTQAFKKKDYDAIEEIRTSDNVFRLLVHSLCPTLFGHEAAKAGIILGLFGGTESGNGIRPNPHVLLVGDPGLGKSQLLQAATLAAPKGVYVSGDAASAGGLTVALAKEPEGDYAIEAGALVLADEGVCCVDELDKMSAHHESLLEAMEQRYVSVSKGGVMCRLAARATVLAAANPASGCYSRAKTVAENLNLNSALLSRFDLVFILLDRPSQKTDPMLSDHTMTVHPCGNKKRMNERIKLNLSLDSNQPDSDVSLSDKLRLMPGEVIDTLPLVLLKKYITYARSNIHPTLSSESVNVLQDFYLELRHKHQDNDSTPVTARQLEACLRLTQARARVDLRNEATAGDAYDVISLVKHCLMDSFSDEFGNIDLSRSINGSGVSSRNKVKKFLDVLNRRSHQTGKDLFSRKELVEIHKSAGIAGDPHDLIDAMHIHNYLLLKEPNIYQLISF